MAIYHMSVKTVSRSHGRSATAAAAYRAGAVIADDRTGVVYDFRRKGGVESADILLPVSAPEWAQDRSTLWNAAEQYERRKNSTVAREFEVALPAELSSDERRDLAMEFAKELVVRHGFAADVAVHAPSKKGDNRNYHAHILVTTRRMTEEGFSEKTRELDDKKFKQVPQWRERWGELANAALARAGQDARIDHRSLVDQQDAALEAGCFVKAFELDRMPQEHVGVHATAIDRRAGVTHSERGLRREETLDQANRARARAPSCAAGLWVCARGEARADELKDVLLGRGRAKSNPERQYDRQGWAESAQEYSSELDFWAELRPVGIPAQMQWGKFGPRVRNATTKTDDSQPVPWTIIEVEAEIDRLSTNAKQQLMDLPGHADLSDRVNTLEICFRDAVKAHLKARGHVEATALAIQRWRCEHRILSALNISPWLWKQRKRLDLQQMQAAKLGRVHEEIASKGRPLAAKLQQFRDHHLAQIEAELGLPSLRDELRTMRRTEREDADRRHAYLQGKVSRIGAPSCLQRAYQSQLNELGWVSVKMNEPVIDWDAVALHGVAAAFPFSTPEECVKALEEHMPSEQARRAVSLVKEGRAMAVVEACLQAQRDGCAPLTKQARLLQEVVAETDDKVALRMQLSSSTRLLESAERVVNEEPIYRLRNISKSWPGAGFRH